MSELIGTMAINMKVSRETYAIMLLHQIIDGMGTPFSSDEDGDCLYCHSLLTERGGGGPHEPDCPYAMAKAFLESLKTP